MFGVRSRFAILLMGPALIAFGSARPFAAPPDAGRADAGAADAASPLPACIRVSADSRYRNAGYDHIVIIQNGCEQAASCEIVTDVNPDVIYVRVEAGEALEVVTFRGSPAYTFTARVQCKLES